MTLSLMRTRLSAIVVMAAVSFVACRSGALGAQGAQNPQPQDPNAPVVPVYSPMAAKPGGPLTPRPSGYKVDAIDFLLFPGQTVEYKFRLDKGATMVYTWKADFPVRFDFHTVPDGKPLSASERFEAAEAAQASGTYVAPYPGLHGWWWENVGKEEVNIRVQAAGFFTEAVMFSGTEQTPFEVKDPPAPEN